MAAGGIHDQVGGGFARYAVDARWLVPHFEKMLYDNALLARAYLHGWQVSGDPLLREVTETTLDWMLREMRGPEGGFYSALDADSEGVEGRFYVWSLDELRDVLGDDADEAIAWFGATQRGNFEGSNILVRGEGSPAGLPDWRRRLYAVREKRVWPGLDDKRLTAWNALAISALAEAGAVLERSDYLDAATGAAEFVLAELRDGDGRLLRSWKDGRGRLNAYLEDHAFLLEALITLYEASFDPRWFAAARELADTMIERFADPESGGFFETSADHERLVARRKDLEDHPIPSGNASAALGLLRLAALTGEYEYERHAVSVLRLLHELAPKHPQAFGHLLQALDFHLSPTREVALAGADTQRARARGARGVQAQHRAGRRRARRRAAPSGSPPDRGPRRRLRVRALRLPGAGDRARGARTAALLTLLAFVAPGERACGRRADLGMGPAARRRDRRGARAPLHGARLPRGRPAGGDPALRGAGTRQLPQRDRRARHAAHLPADRDGPHRLGPRRAGRQRQRVRPRRAGRAGGPAAEARAGL